MYYCSIILVLVYICGVIRVVVKSDAFSTLLVLPNRLKVPTEQAVLPENFRGTLVHVMP